MPTNPPKSDIVQPVVVADNAASSGHDTKFCIRTDVDTYEAQLLLDALERHKFNQRATAAFLKLSYDQLRHALKKHGISCS